MTSSITRQDTKIGACYCEIIGKHFTRNNLIPEHLFSAAIFIAHIHFWLGYFTSTYKTLSYCAQLLIVGVNLLQGTFTTSTCNIARSNIVYAVLHLIS